MADMKPRHAAPLALVITWYLMAPPSMREDSWSCSGSLLATISHDLFGTGDQNVCEQWAKIADLSAPLSKWHEMASFDTIGACEKARDDYTIVPGAQPENVAQCFATSNPRLTGRGQQIMVR
jgi:hypothetical protein